MADWLTGLVGGFADRKRAVEEQEYAEGLRSRQREAAVLQTLINSPDDDVRSLAITGLLESAGPAKRKSGLAGWLGQVQTSPWLERIRGLSSTVTRTGTLRDVPTQQGYIPDAPPAVGSAAQVPTSPTVQGKDGGGLTETVVGTAPPDSPIVPDVRNRVPGAQGGVLTYQYDTPRRVFPTAADTASADAYGRAAGDVEGEIAGLVAAGYSEEQARDLVKQTYLRRTVGAAGATPYTAYPGQTFDDATGKWIDTYGSFNRATNQWTDAEGRTLKTFRRTPTSNSTSLGIMFERAARDLGFESGAAATSAGAATQVNERVVQLLQEEAYARGTGTGQARYDAPLTPTQAATVGAPVGTTGPQLAGQTPGTALNRDSRRSLEVARQEIQQRILPLVGRVLPSAQERFGTVAPGAILAARRLDAQWQPLIAELESALNSIKTSLARARGDTRLSNVDLQRIDQSLALIERGWENMFGADNRESAAARLNETLANLDLVLSGLPADLVPTGPAAGAGGAGAVGLATPPPGLSAPGIGGPPPMAATGAGTAGVPPSASPVAAPPPGGARPSDLDRPITTSTGQRMIIRDGQLVIE